MGAEELEGMERGRGLLLQREQEGEKGGRVFPKTVAKGRYKESCALALCLGGWGFSVKLCEGLSNTAHQRGEQGAGRAPTEQTLEGGESQQRGPAGQVEK